jgi:hypothetical protein
MACANIAVATNASASAKRTRTAAARAAVNPTPFIPLANKFISIAYDRTLTNTI